MTPLAMARRLLARGFAPIPVPAGTKAPVVKGWQALRLTAAELPAAFGNGANIGLLNGAPSNNLADTDLVHGDYSRVTPHRLPIQKFT